MLAHREYRYWRLLRGDDVLGHVGHLDEVQALTGTTLVETGGDGAALAPGTLPPDLHAEVSAARTENEATTAALDQARSQWRHLALSLRRGGLSSTETAKALGVSRPAVDKLVARATADTAPTDSPALAGAGTPPGTPLDAVTGALEDGAPDPQAMAARVEAVRRQVAEATARQEEFSGRWRRLAVALQDAGLTNRDVAHLMGIKEPRVTQLAPRDGRRSAPTPTTARSR
ncbi:hypothetical protein [Kineococcus aurantiacus]|uniref:Plasmid maintenance system antidote protein VapI n=1 Tax=Kineococcus aurantiacus TaxID=37633 RepID=A0A7Y9DR94_9ACTN|nr:hypothetical protein [Kineococcus aurantiacus]NYD25006.1 plasmid maintenance system antidote protein VapI [Kineococcus aurantiacus]